MNIGDRMYWVEFRPSPMPRIPYQIGVHDEPVTVERMDEDPAFVWIHAGLYAHPGEAWTNEPREGSPNGLHRVPIAMLATTFDDAIAIGNLFKALEVKQ